MSFKYINIEPYGESHAEKIGVIIRNFPRGIKIDYEKINEALNLRLKNNSFNTTRNKSEQFKVISGIKNDYTTSRPIVIELLNNGSRSDDYQHGQIRPSHADYVGYLLDKDNYEFSGGGIFSGRNTALYVLCGEIARQCLVQKGFNIKVYSQISKIKNIEDDLILDNLDGDLDKILHKEIQMINNDKITDVYTLIEQSNENLSGEVTTVIENCPSLLGGYFFDNIKSQISSLMLSIPSSRSIAFGDFKKNDTDKLYVEQNIVKCDTNFDGGINGGFTNGVTPVYFIVGYKAPSTSFDDVSTIKYEDNMFRNTTLKMTGRHDKLIVNRAIYAQHGLTYLMLLDNLLHNGKYYDM